MVPSEAVHSQGKIRFGQRLRQLVQKRPASQILVFVTSSTHANHSTGYVMTASSKFRKTSSHQMFGNILRADQLNFSGGPAVVTTNTAIGTIMCSKKYRCFIRSTRGGNLRGVFFVLIEQRIAVIGGTSGIGFAVESKGLHSSAWRVGKAGDAF